MLTAHPLSKVASRLQILNHRDLLIPSTIHTSTSVFSSVLSANPRDKVLEWSVNRESLDTDTITFDFSLFLEADEVRHDVLGETVSSGEENDLTTSELETSSVKGLSGVFNEVRFGSNGDENLIDGDTSSLDVGFTEGLTHTLLESISTSA